MFPQTFRGWSCTACEPERLELLSAVEVPKVEGGYVLLWLQQDPRAECNHALEAAASLANCLRAPLVAAYGLCERFPGATERSFAFLLDGLAELRQGLAARGVPLVVGRAAPPAVVAALAAGARAVVCDMGYTRVVRGWRRELAQSLDCPLLQVETNVVVPVRAASARLEPAAATLRPRLLRLLPRFLRPVQVVSLERPGSAAVVGLRERLAAAGICELDVTDTEAALALLDLDRSAPRVPGWRGGPSAALERLEAFVQKHIGQYHQKRKDPAAQCQSQLSPYLHFGQVSALQVLLWLQQRGLGPQAQTWAEELVVRRELARNMVLYNPEGYDDYQSVVPGWARLSLQAHASDARPRRFSSEDLEFGRTDDDAWNAAQHEMLASGHMHNYMRMYWCKQLLLWTASPREAFETACRLNDRWELDGRDENGYMGIAWCFGNHDNEFPERPVFGTVRCMTRSGLKGKVDVARYIEVVRKKCTIALKQDSRYGPLLPRPKGILGFISGTPRRQAAPSKPPTSSAAAVSAVPTGGKGVAVLSPPKTGPPVSAAMGMLAAAGAESGACAGLGDRRPSLHEKPEAAAAARGKRPREEEEHTEPEDCVIVG